MKGRKRHIMVDILGHLLAVKVHAAPLADTTSAAPVFQEALRRYPTLQAFSDDAGDRKTAEIFVRKKLKLMLPMTPKPKTKKGQFKVLPKRWMVERTFAWLGHFRR